MIIFRSSVMFAPNMAVRRLGAVVHRQKVEKCRVGFHASTTMIPKYRSGEDIEQGRRWRQVKVRTPEAVPPLESSLMRAAKSSSGWNGGSGDEDPQQRHFLFDEKQPPLKAA